MKVHHTNAAFQDDADNEGTTVVNVTADKVVLKSVASLPSGNWQHQIHNNSEGLSKGIRGLSGSVVSDGSDDSSKSKNEGDVTLEDGGSLGGETISILGTGDFGRALGGRLVKAGYHVNVGSRDPEVKRARLSEFGCRGVTQIEAIEASHIVIVAVPREFYADLPLSMIGTGKTVVDVSNRNSVKRKGTLSQAEYLQSLIPNANVVKAFNVLSAYSLESGGIQGSKEVLIAGDSSSAKEEVSSVVRACGFTPVDMGGLRAAREIEDIPVSRFEGWKMPFLISTVLFLFLYLLGFAKYQVCWTYLFGDGTWHWGRFHYLPMGTMNKTLSVHAITMLTLCYLPGVIAAWLQIVRGTKYSRFPNWLDQWLKMRKQLGLLMLLSASMHACLSVAVMSPALHNLAYDDPNEISTDVVVGGNYTHPQLEEDQRIQVPTGTMDWRGELFIMAGVISYTLSLILGIVSLPSVTASLTWKEFAFVQSKLGWICLLVAIVHNVSYGWKYLFTPSCYIPSSFQYCLYLPAVTIMLKIPLLCLSGHLDKIRGGWERNKRHKKRALEEA